MKTNSINGDPQKTKPPNYFLIASLARTGIVEIIGLRIRYSVHGPL